jgi:hypothetical protein
VCNCPEPMRANFNSRSCARWPELIQDARDFWGAFDLVQDAADRRLPPESRLWLWQSWFDSILYQVYCNPGTRQVVQSCTAPSDRYRWSCAGKRTRSGLSCTRFSIFLVQDIVDKQSAGRGDGCTIAPCRDQRSPAGP